MKTYDAKPKDKFVYIEKFIPTPGEDMNFTTGETVIRLGSTNNLTAGRKYEIMAVDGGNIQVINDSGDKECFSKYGFAPSITVKVGDRFQWKKSDGTFFKTGDIGRVTEERANGQALLFNETQMRYITGVWYMRTASWGKIDSPCGSKTELEQLVDDMNKGIQAKRRLMEKYSGQAEYVHADGNPSQLKVVPDFSVRVKDKRFTISKYEVIVKGDDVKIGCRTYPKYVIKEAAAALYNETMTRYESRGFIFSASRTGVVDIHGSIPWADVKKLMEEI